MIDGKYDVVFRGQVVRNMDEAVVKSNLVTLFKSSPEAVDKLFGGNEVVVRTALDYSTAMKYQSALKKAGALALIKEVEKKAVASSQGKATFGPVSDAPEESSSEQVVPKETAPQETVLQPVQETETIAAQVSELGSESGVDDGLDRQDIKDTPNDSESSHDNMSLAKVGTQILPNKVYEKRDVDTSQLSLALLGERILPDKQPENHPQPSIDHLKLED